MMREDMSVSNPDIQLIYILVNLQDTTPAIGSSSELQTPVVPIPSPSDAASTSNTASDIPSTVPPTPTATSTSPSSIQSINTAIDPASSQSCRFATAGLNMSSFFLTPSFHLSFLLFIFFLHYTVEVVTTLAGSGEEGYKDGKGPKASFQRPHGICINQRDGCLYACDTQNNAIRRVSMQGIHHLEHSHTSSFRLIYHDICRWCNYFHVSE